MYEPHEIPPMPSDEEIAEAISVLCTVAMNAEGNITGDIKRLPEETEVGVRAFDFHFNFHDARVCDHAESHKRQPGEESFVVSAGRIDKSKLN